MKKTLITIELFLVLLVVLLFAFLLFIFTNKKIGHEDAVVTPVSVDASEVYCGITVTTPNIDAVIELPLEISGYVSGCGWEPHLDYVARLNFYNEKNEPLGRPYLVHTTSGNSSPVSTQFLITINDLPIRSGHVRAVFRNFGIIEKEFILPLFIQEKTVDENVE